jgi:hypothetical protein
MLSLAFFALISLFSIQKENMFHLHHFGEDSQGHEHEEWDDAYLPHLPRPAFRSPHRHYEHSNVGVGEDHPEREVHYDHPEREVHSDHPDLPADGALPAVKVLQMGHSRKDEITGDIYANCTVTLIRGRKFNVLVDTMTAWDGHHLTDLLASKLKNRPFSSQIYWQLVLLQIVKRS